MGAEELGILVALRCVHVGFAVQPLGTRPTARLASQGALAKAKPPAVAPLLAAASTQQQTSPSADDADHQNHQAGAQPQRETNKSPPTIAGAGTDGALPYEALPPTHKAYLEPGGPIELKTTIVGATATEVVLAATVFHPQGGGQPADRGTIRVDDGNVFTVTMVKATARGADARVVHQGAWETTASVPEPGASATAAVDRASRELAARYHSAGHAIDVAMGRAGHALVPAKGYHFFEGAYVEYDGTIDDPKALVDSLNAHLRAIVDEDAPTRYSTDAATGDRIVEIAGQACPCGGTHVASTRLLGKVQVTKAKNKAKKLRVSYTVSD